MVNFIHKFFRRLFVWIVKTGFNPNNTPVEVIKEGAFRGTCFMSICSVVNEKWYRKSWKELDHLGGIDQKYYCSDYYDVGVNKYGAEHH